MQYHEGGNAEEKSVIRAGRLPGIAPQGCNLDIEGMVSNVIEAMVEGLTATYTIQIIGGTGLNATGLNIAGEYLVAAMEFGWQSGTLRIHSICGIGHGFCPNTSL